MGTKYMQISFLRNIDELRNLQKCDRLFIIFKNDIDFKNIDNFEPLDFHDKDVFIKGLNHTISNLNINTPNRNEVGFISRAKNLYIDDINIKNFNIIANEVCGSIIGKVDDNLCLKNIFVRSNINCDAIAGSICGISKNIEVKNSKFDVSLNGRGALGGICGVGNNLYIDSESRVNATINSKYSKYVNDPACGNYVGYLSSERNLMTLLRETTEKLPIEIDEGEMERLYLALNKKIKL